jgi:hypothetical protein
VVLAQQRETRIGFESVSLVDERLDEAAGDVGLAVEETSRAATVPR